GGGLQGPRRSARARPSARGAGRRHLPRRQRGAQLAVELARVSASAAVICDACGQARAPFHLGPMLHDHIWPQIAAPGERALCDMCMYDRAFERLGRVLTLADLRPCGFNLFHRPDSWFDLFSQRAQGPPPNLAEWQAASAEIDAR